MRMGACTQRERRKLKWLSIRHIILIKTIILPFNLVSTYHSNLQLTSILNYLLFIKYMYNPISIPVLTSCQKSRMQLLYVSLNVNFLQVSNKNHFLQKLRTGPLSMFNYTHDLSENTCHCHSFDIQDMISSNYKHICPFPSNWSVKLSNISHPSSKPSITLHQRKYVKEVTEKNFLAKQSSKQQQTATGKGKDCNGSRTDRILFSSLSSFYFRGQREHHSVLVKCYKDFKLHNH